MITCLRMLAILGLVAACANGTRADDRADLIGLIDKAVKAMGGEEKVAKLQTLSWKGNATHQSGAKTYTFIGVGSAQAWDKYMTDVEMRLGAHSRKMLTVLNGGKLWGRENNGAVVELSSDLQAFWKDGLYPVRACQLLPLLEEKKVKLSHMGELTIGATQAVGIQIGQKDHKDLNLYFDKESGLPVKAETRLTKPGGMEFGVEYLFSDYKEFDGIKHFSRIIVNGDGKEFVMELSQLQPQEKLDERLFAKP